MNGSKKTTYKFNEYQLSWLKALRSGEYKQAQGSLVGEGGESFCCLGVACIEAGYTPDALLGFDNLGTFESVQDNLKLNDNSGKLFCGFKSVRAGCEVSSFYVKFLTGMNDGLLWSFDQIADYIEANPENVFSDEQ